MGTSTAGALQGRNGPPSGAPWYAEEEPFLESLAGVPAVRAESFAEAMPSGRTASPCDIAKTSETLDAFAFNSPAIQAAHRPIVNRLADCILALRGGSRPIREVEIVGFTDPSGLPGHNQTLGQQRADAVRDALVAALNARSAGSGAAFTFRTRSLGETQQVSGGAAANRRVEVFVPISVTDIVVHSSDTDTHEIASNLGPTGLEHFCCVKGTGDIVLEAHLSPSIPGAASTRLAWRATGTGIVSPAVGSDARTAKLSSAVSGKFPVQLTWDGVEVRRAVVWVIWSTVRVTATRAASTPPVAFAGLSITAGIDHSFTITPDRIITDADRPALAGASTTAVPGAALTHVVSGNTLAGGATLRWDTSRQIRVRILNPHLYPTAQLSAVAGHLWAGQPAATATPENYPTNDALGNDDSSVLDPENNDPYTNAGVVTGTDDPTMSMSNATGADGDTFERRYHFREFMRVNLGNRWYRASDYSLWRFHGRFRRNAGAWTNNGSTLRQDNTGF